MNFANDFFKREVRDGFEISEMMKRAWGSADGSIASGCRYM